MDRWIQLGELDINGMYLYGSLMQPWCWFCFILLEFNNELFPICSLSCTTISFLNG